MHSALPTQFRAVLFKPLGMTNFITPFRENPDHCLSVGEAPSQGLVYALDTDIVIKLPFQYPIQDELDDDAGFWMDHALQSFVAMEKETSDHLERAWINANETMRYRWVRQLLDAVSWLEELGYTHGDLAVRNLAVNSSNCLKLLDFGSTTPTDHYDYAADVKRDHSDLSTCLHFILTGIDPLANVHSAQEARQIESQLLRGCGTIEGGAEILADVIQAGWTGRLHQPSFPELRNVLRLSLALRMRKMHHTLWRNITDA